MFTDYLETFNSILKNTVITDNKGKLISRSKAFIDTATLLTNLRKKSKMLYLVGNGGSNALVSHASVDLLNTCGIKAYPLTNSSNLTCFANDYGYENVFKKPLEVLFTSGDGLIAVSSSGSSDNIINAATIAKEKQCKIITFSAFNENNKLRKLGDINFWLDSNNYGFVEIGHSFLLHFICDTLDNNNT